MIISGYPHIIPPPGEPVGTCSAWLQPEEETYWADTQTRVNDKAHQAVTVVKTETGKDIRFVDPFAVGSPFMERDTGQLLTSCSTSPLRYMNGFDNLAGFWHPNISGQARYAQLIETALP